MAGPLPYDHDPRFTEEELRERENNVDSDADVSGSDGENQAIGLRRGEPNVRPPRIDNTDWCICDLCIAMPKEMECICCNEVNNYVMFVNEKIKCITENSDFPSVCLNRGVLRTSLVMRNDIRGHSGRSTPFDLDKK